MQESEQINIKTKRQAIILLILLIVIGGIVMYGKPREKVQPKYDTAPKVKGPTSPPPHQNIPANETTR